MDQTNQNENNPIFFLLYKILLNSEFSLAYLEDIFKIISIHGNSDDFISCLLKQLNQNQQKNIIKISNSYKLVLSQEALLNYPILNFLLIYNFFNSHLFESFFEELDYIKQTMQESQNIEIGNKAIFSNTNYKIINSNLSNNNNNNKYSNYYNHKNFTTSDENFTYLKSSNNDANIYLLFRNPKVKFQLLTGCLYS